MCPSDDNRCSDSLQIECCYYSNIAPQYTGLNRGEWLMLENLTRTYATQYDSIHIWAGSIGVSDSMKSVKIPKQCWKVLYIKKANKYIAYLFNNDNNGDGDITNNIVSIDIIEKLTGYKFK